MATQPIPESPGLPPQPGVTVPPPEFNPPGPDVDVPPTPDIDVPDPIPGSDPGFSTPSEI